MIIILLLGYLIFGYLVFNILYNKKKKLVFKIFAFLPKVFLILYTLLLIPFFVSTIHYRQLEDYKNLEIKSISDIQNLTNLESIHYYKSDEKEYKIIIETKYQDYISICDQSMLEILDTAGALDEKLIPQEISDISKIIIFMIIACFVLAIIIALFVNDKKNIIFVIGFISFIILMAFISGIESVNSMNTAINK